MLEDIRALLILQDRDRRLLSIAKDLEKLPQDEQRATQKLAGDQKAVADAKQALNQLEVQLRNLELDVQTRKTTIARLKHQQFETRKNEEFQALAHEVVRYEKEIDQLETRELELMEEIDTLKAAHKAAEAQLAKSQTLVNEDLASLRSRQEKLRAQQQETQTERATLATRIPEAILPLYQRLMNTKNGLAVARMNDGKCEGCHMKLIASTVVAVQSNKEIVRCENCGRMLYLED